VFLYCALEVEVARVARVKVRVNQVMQVFGIVVTLMALILAQVVQVMAVQIQTQAVVQILELPQVGVMVGTEVQALTLIPQVAVRQDILAMAVTLVVLAYTAVAAAAA
jgi:hypothetical protein